MERKKGSCYWSSVWIWTEGHVGAISKVGRQSTLHFFPASCLWFRFGVAGAVLHPTAQPLLLCSWKQWKEPKPQGWGQRWFGQGCAPALRSLPAPRAAEAAGGGAVSREEGAPTSEAEDSHQRCLTSCFRAPSTSLSLEAAPRQLVGRRKLAPETGTARTGGTHLDSQPVALQSCRRRRLQSKDGRAAWWPLDDVHSSASEWSRLPKSSCDLLVNMYF